MNFLHFSNFFILWSSMGQCIFRVPYGYGSVKDSPLCKSQGSSEYRPRHGGMRELSCVVSFRAICPGWDCVFLKLEMRGFVPVVGKGPPSQGLSREGEAVLACTPGTEVHSTPGRVGTVCCSHRKIFIIRTCVPAMGTRRAVRAIVCLSLGSLCRLCVLMTRYFLRKNLMLCFRFPSLIACDYVFTMFKLQ